MAENKAILLHICCGPCSIMPALRLQDDGYNIKLWFMNPNIQPLSEYFRRREAALLCAEKLGLELIIDDAPWDLALWLSEQMPRLHSPGRCQWCCGSRLEAARIKAGDLGCAFFSTSLLYSRYQPHEYIAARGRELDAEAGPRFYYRDFREDWQAGIDKAIAWHIYRQPYCGCVFSESERYAKKLARLTCEAAACSSKGKNV